MTVEVAVPLKHAYYSTDVDVYCICLHPALQLAHLLFITCSLMPNSFQCLNEERASKGRSIFVQQILINRIL